MIKGGFIKGRFFYIVIMILINYPLCSQDYFVNNFSLGIEVDYQNWKTKLNNYKIDVDKASDYDIGLLNNNYNLSYKYQSYNFMIGYKLFDELSVNAIIGLAIIANEMDDIRTDVGKPEQILLTNNPGIETGLMFNYHLPVTEKIGIVFEPQFKYIQANDLHLIYNGYEGFFKDFNINESILNWKFVVYSYYKIDWYSPFLGITYHDLINKISSTGINIDFFNNKEYFDREMKFNQKTPFAITAGFNFLIKNEHMIQIRADFFNGYSVICQFCLNMGSKNSLF
jgi:hypothetical protein